MAGSMTKRKPVAWDSVAIVGVGLIGGSIALALRQRGLAKRVIGIGRRQSSLRRAKQCQAVTDTTTDLKRGVAQAQLIVVCTPVERIAEHVRQAAQHCLNGAIITDAGSTKTEIVTSLPAQFDRDVAFVGSHPLAGSEKTGPQAARADLLEGRLVVLTPLRSTASQHVTAIEKFWKSLGCQVVRMTPQAHDTAIASTSHLPHLIASALAAATPEKLIPLTSSGWADTTRIAAGDVELWTQILSDNRGNVLKSIDKFAKVLASFQSALTRNDRAKIARLLTAGKQNRDVVGS